MEHEMIDWGIIDKALQGTLSEIEQKEFERWLSLSKEHQQIFNKYKSREEYNLGEEQYRNYASEFNKRLKFISQKRRKHYLLIKCYVAASILILFTGGLYFYFHTPSEISPTHKIDHNIKPDPTKVYLTTTAGNMIDMSLQKQEDTLNIEGVEIIKHGQMLSYTSFTQNPASNNLNTINVPKGAEFQIKLSDGSHVWLNSESQFTYPTNFTGQTREVFLQGEAYFEVSKDENKPFCVKNENINITVLGTEFNLNTRNAQSISTTLVQGKVVVTINDSTNLILLPGEMAIANKETGQLSSIKVNVERYIAWKQGEYFFEDTTLEEILNELSRWYDIQIRYDDEKAKQEKFSGWLSRSESIVNILDLIEQTTYVHFLIQNKEIIVKSNY